jgi:mannan endo-1,4-beta-mannosidase
MRYLLTFYLVICAAIELFPFPVAFTVNQDSGRQAISPYIYGTNQRLTGAENWAAYRQGGNRLTGYNWENNASTAGTDYNNSSDNYLTWIMGISGGAENTPGIVITAFHDSNQAKGAYSLITLQMAGYAAKDKNGTVAAGEAAPSARWAEVRNLKGSALSPAPSLADNFVFMDELTAFLVDKYGGAAAATGIRGYALDNEPALWPSTHPLIHPNPPACLELLAKSIGLAGTIKGQDPAAETFGPVAFGFSEYLDFQGAPDWNSVKGSADWFLAYYLDRMKKASDSAGHRLLDALDIHWYSEARGNNERIVQAADPANRANALARVQAPRTLWDSSYVEDSWIGQWNSPVALLPHIQGSINRYNPGTKIALTEWNYGGENHISGGLAVADVLGIFGKYGVYFASWWQMDAASNYVSAAVKLYRNYDGAGARFGDIRVRAASADDSLSSVYAAESPGNGNQLHLIVLNKHFDSTMQASFQVAGARNFTTGAVWGLGPASAAVTARTAVGSITNNTFTYAIPPLTAVHIVLSTGASTAQAEPPAGKAPGLEVHPLPFRGSGAIGFQAPAGSPSRLCILDTRGRVVRDFPVRGKGSFLWNGEGVSGPVPSGVYFAVLRTENLSVQKKMVLLR